MFTILVGRVGDRVSKLGTVTEVTRRVSINLYIPKLL